MTRAATAPRIHRGDRSRHPLLTPPLRTLAARTLATRTLAASGAWFVVSWLVVFTNAAGCAGAGPCIDGERCGEAPGCNQQGACDGAARRREARFARPLWVHATEWSGAHGGASGTLDEMALGSALHTTTHLVFEPVPRGVFIVRAWLTLFPHPSEAGPSTAVPITAHRSFRTSEGSRSAAQWTFDGPPVGGAIARPYGPRPIRVDLTDHCRTMARLGDRRIALALRASPADATLRYASPLVSDPLLRPRLELLVR